MSANSLEDYLQSWGLSMYIEKFAEQAIDINTLQILSEDNIKDLIPIIGHRAILSTQISILKSIIGKAYPTTIELSTVLENDLEYTNLIENDNGSTSIVSNQEDQLSLSILEDEDVDACEKPKCDLYHLLNSANEGKALLLNFENGLLDNAARRKLCNIIINNELKNDPDKKIPSSRFYQLAYEVTKVFKKESSSIYFIPFASFSPQQKTSAKGKLLDCFRQRRREYLKSGIIKTRNRRSSSVCSSHSNSSGSASPRPTKRVFQVGNHLEETHSAKDIEEALLWLKNSCDPWLNVERYWEITAKKRFAILDENITIRDYFCSFKPLSLPGGLYLLLSDVKILYPERDNQLFENWPLLRDKIIGLAKKRVDSTLKEILNNIDETEDEVLDVVAFMSLPFLMTTSTIRKARTASKQQWRPSKVEVLEGFITHVKSGAELEESITRRKAKLATLGLTLQPYIIIVGPTIREISGIYIIINDIKYSKQQDLRYDFFSIVRAVDACFKILFVLNAEYPIECMHIWQFIQRAFFKMTTKYDKIYTTVNVLMTELGIGPKTSI